MNTKVLAFAVLLMAANTARAQWDDHGSPPAAHELVQAELVCETAVVKGGEPFWVAIKLTMKDEWHVNWINPGDAGLAPTVAWLLPAGWTAGELQWPYPTRFDITELSIFGYGGTVVLLAEITPPARLAPDATQISARIDWLACAEACVPGQSVVTIAIPPTEMTAARSQGPSIFDRTRQTLPAEAPAWRFDAGVDDGYVEIRMTAPQADAEALERVSFFPLDTGIIQNASKQVLAGDSGIYRLRIPRDDMNPQKPARIRGVLVSETGWGGDHKAVAVNIAIR